MKRPKAPRHAPNLAPALSLTEAGKMPARAALARLERGYVRAAEALDAFESQGGQYRSIIHRKLRREASLRWERYDVLCKILGL